MINRSFLPKGDFFPPFLVAREEGVVIFGEEWAYRQAYAAGYPTADHPIRIANHAYTVSVILDPDHAQEPGTVFLYERPLLAFFDRLAEHADPVRAKPLIHDLRVLYDRIATCIRTYICAGLRATPFVYEFNTGTEVDSESFVLAAALAAALLCRAGNQELTLAFEVSPEGCPEIVLHASRVPTSPFLRDVLFHMGLAGNYYALFSADGIHFRFVTCPITYVIWRAPDPFHTEEFFLAQAAKFLGIVPDKPGISYYD